MTPVPVPPAASDGLTATERALLDALTRDDRVTLTFPLSEPAQRRIWLSQLAGPDSPSLRHGSIALRLRGPLDPDAQSGW